MGERDVRGKRREQNVHCRRICYSGNIKIVSRKMSFSSFLSLLKVACIVGGYIRLLFGSGGTHVHF